MVIKELICLLELLMLLLINNTHNGTQYIIIIQLIHMTCKHVLYKKNILIHNANKSVNI